MTEPRQDSPQQQRKRYPGARPFTDSPEDQQIFFGRDADIDRLFERVVGSRLLVLFGRSGLGKTSLLMAGLFPKLRKEKPLLPVPIRINTLDSPAHIVIAAVTQACKHAGAELTSGDTAGVWEFLHSSLIWSDDLLETPVLVFDQFEEIFTLRDSAFRTALACELGALASGVPPERLRAVKGGRAERGARLGENPPEVKILLSLREEYLGTLQELAAQIPGLFQERFRLSPLGEKDARFAICSPAGCVAGPQDVPFATPSFEYDTDALQDLLTFLGGRSGVIEPFQLQLLCCRAEEIVGARAKEVIAAAERAGRLGTAASKDSDEMIPAFRITRADLGGPAGMEDVLRQFYRRVINMLGWRDRRRARRLCEEGMLSATGSRIMLDQAQIQSDYGVRGPALKTLVDERLLRAEQRLESLFYEISHDRLAKSIENSRPFRIPRKHRLMLRGAAVVGLGTIGVLFYWNQEIKQARSEAERLVSFLIGESFLDKLRPVGRNAILEEVQSEVQAFLSKAPDQGRLGHLHIRGLALRNKGHILKSQGKIGEAIGKFRESAEVFERLAATRSASAAMKAEQARSLDALGESLGEQGKITEALEVHRKALALRQDLFDAGNHEADTTIDVADSNSSVANDLNEMGKPQQALAYLDRARELLRPFEATAARSPKLLSALHSAIDTRASAVSFLGDEQGAKDASAQAKKVTDEWLDHHPFSADAHAAQIYALSRSASQQMWAGATSQALVQYEQMHREVSQLTRWDETNASWRRDFAATLLLQADGFSANKQDEEATRSYSTALQISADLAQADQSVANLKQLLSWGYQSRGKFALERKQWRQAVEDLTAAQEFMAAASGTDGARATWRRDWAYTYFYLAKARAEGGENWPSEAVDLLRRGRAMLESLITTAPEMTILFGDLVTFYREEIFALERGGRETEAAAVTQEKERTVAAVLAARPTDPWLLYQASLEDAGVGNRAKSAGQSDEALAAYRRGTEKLAHAAELEPQNVNWWQNLVGAHEMIADLLENRKDAAGAEAELRAAVDAGQRAVQLGNSARSASLATYGLYKQGRFYERAMAPDKALLAYELAGRNADLAAKLDPSNGLYFWNMSMVHRWMGSLREKAGATEKARVDYEVAVNAGQRAVELEPSDGQYWQALYTAQSSLAANTEGAGDSSGAVVLFRDALKNAQKAAALLRQDESVTKDVLSLEASVKKLSP